VLRRVCQAAAFLILALAALLAVVLAWKSWLAIETIGVRFFLGTTWDPEPTHRQFGALAFVWGTVTTSLIAMLIAVPLGVGTAAFLSEIAPGWLRRAGSFFVEMLAAIPSVVYGFWGLFVLAPLLNDLYVALGGPNQGGLGILAAGLILSIMIVPYVAAVSFDVIRAVPRSQREGALALGATRWQTIRRVVLPYARPGIIGGSFLALGRALGETMAVTMLIGNKAVVDIWPFTLGNSIASVIASEFREADYDLYLSALVELALVLLLVNVTINALARVLIARVSRPRPSRSLRARLLAFWRPRPTLAPAAGEGGEPTRTYSRYVGSATAERKAAWVNRLMTGTEGHAYWGLAVLAVLAGLTVLVALLVQDAGLRSDLITLLAGLAAATVLATFGVLGLCLAVTTVPLFLILGYLLYQGASALNWDFFVNLPTPVGEPGGGMANALYGSLLLIGLASLFAVPVGLLAAIYLAEYRSDRFAPTVRFVGELLGGVPSIVIGLFVYALVVKPMGHFSAWAGGFALGVIMVPIVMRAAEEALKLVPRSLREASYALGARQWQTVLRVSVPAALPAVITAVFLGIARIAGETAPLLLTASGNQFWPRSPNDPTPSLPFYIYTYAVSHDADWHRQAWAAAFVLVAVVMLLNFGVRLLAGKRVIQASHAD
jgi:phosphate transport system permease protein